jgi:hypothetical protein
MMGNIEASGGRNLLGRRRRTMFGSDSGGSSGNGTPRRDGDINALLAAAAAGSSNRSDGQNDLPPGRHSSRRGNRLEDLEELMMMEAIRLSLAAEEERKKKEEKEAAKEAKKEEKKKAKEAKKTEKAARRSTYFPSSSSTTNLDGEDDSFAGSSSAGMIGKGKAVDRSGGSVGFNPISEPTSTLNASSSRDDPQRHLEHSRAQIQRETSSTGNLPPFDPSGEQPSHRAALRNLSNASSSVSSLADSLSESLPRDGQGGLGASASSYEGSPNASGISLNHDETPPQGTPGTEPMFNFKSLAAVMTSDKDEAQHIENVANGGEAPKAEQSSSEYDTPDISIQSPNSSEASGQPAAEALDESVMTLKPKRASHGSDDIEPAPRIEAIPHDHANGLDAKHIGEISMVRGQEATQ